MANLWPDSRFQAARPPPDQGNLLAIKHQPALLMGKN
jgi:hypothetical protein